MGSLAALCLAVHLAGFVASRAAGRGTSEPLRWLATGGARKGKAPCRFLSWALASLAGAAHEELTAAEAAVGVTSPYQRVVAGSNPACLHHSWGQ